MSNNNAILRAIALKKKFPNVIAVDEVSLNLQSGEIVCVIGPNGSGKTTLLLLLGGIILPSTGHVYVFGLDRWRNNFEIRKRTTFLPVDPVFGASPTPYEYLRFLSQIYGIPKSDFIHRLEKLTEQMNYERYLTKPWNKLSTGLIKKAGLIGSFMPDVHLRILDEPFAGGIDPLGMEVLFRWMSEARERGETILFSTQVLDQAEDVADRLLMLADGAILAQGAPRELIEQAGVNATDTRPLQSAFMILAKKP